MPGFFNRLGRLPWFSRRRAATSRPLGYDLLGELQQDLDPELLPPPRQQVAHASLLESLRALDTVLDVPTVVIAGIDKAESARPAIAGLIIQAHLRGLHLALAKLVPGQGFRVLRKRVPRGDPGEDTRAPGAMAPLDPYDDDGADVSHPEDLALHIVGAPEVEELRAWYQRAAEGSDLLLVEAPPMLLSVDAALLGRCSDGLVLVAESMTTRQEDLETAVERARAAGSPPIGLVLDQHREWLPRVIRKLLPSYPKTVQRRRRKAP
ncbi:MAG: hypothetical protein AAGN66_26225 [Acidobacteriota bacterium]